MEHWPGGGNKNDNENESGCAPMKLVNKLFFSEVNKSIVAGYASVDRDTRSLSHLQHPEPSGSSSQDFSLPIQDMMNPVVF